MPAPSTRLLGSVSAQEWSRGVSLVRGHPSHLSPAGFGPAGPGRPGRFSPVDGAAHAYVARMPSAALLETALRDVAGPDRAIRRPTLAGWSWGRVTTASSLRLADLRDDALAALEIRPEQLTTCSPRHYACTGRWAAALRAAGFAGAVWHSRQAAVHRDAVGRRSGLAATLLTHAAVEVAVLWAPSADEGTLAPDPSGSQQPLLDDEGEPARLVLELAALLDITIEL